MPRDENKKNTHNWQYFRVHPKKLQIYETRDSMIDYKRHVILSYVIEYNVLYNHKKCDL